MYNPRVSHLIGLTGFTHKSAEWVHKPQAKSQLGSRRVLKGHTLPLGGWLTRPLEESGTARKEGCWTYEPVSPVHEDPSAATSG